MKRLNSFLDKHLVAVITLSALVLFESVFLWYFSTGETLLFGDVRSRLLIARRVFDSLTPGLTQLGAVWPPFPQMLFLPTIWNDLFFYSGLSGSLVSIASAVVATFFLAKMVLGITNSKLTTTVTALVLVFNPSFLYMATTPMTEALFISSLILSAYILWRWSVTDNIVYLPLLGVVTVAATMTRYDGWFLAIIETLAVPVVAFIKHKSFTVARGHLFLFATVALVGILGWFAYNQVIYGNLLRFATGEGAAAYAATQTGTSILTKGNFTHSTLVYLSAIALNVSYISLGVIFLIPFLFLLTAKRQFLLPVLIFSAPIVFNIASLFLGQSVLYTPQYQPFYFYNIRYGLLALPLAAIGYGMVVDSLSRFLPTLKVLMVVILLPQAVALFANSPVTLAEARQWYYSPKGIEQQHLTTWLQANRINGLTLISTLANDTLLFDTRTPLKRIIYEGSGSLWHQATTQPSLVVQRIIVSPDIGDEVWTISLANKQFFDGYEVAFSGTYFRVYDLTNNQR